MDNPHECFTYPGVCTCCNQQKDLGHNLTCDHDFCVDCLEKFLLEGHKECPQCSKDIFAEYLNAESNVLCNIFDTLKPEQKVKMQITTLLYLWCLGGMMAQSKCTEHRKQMLQITHQRLTRPS